MKIEDAINYCKNEMFTDAVCPEEFIEEHNKAMTTAIEALEKQIAKKPINDNCEKCGTDVRNWTDGEDKFKYCTECGTAIDWRSNNE